MTPLISSVLLFASSALFFAGESASQFTLGTLANFRKNATFIPFVTAQRQAIITNFQSMETIWPNRQNKIDTFRTFFTSSDPKNLLDKFAKNFTSLSEPEFHRRALEYQTSHLDGHNYYALPGSYSCLTATTGLTFDVASGSSQPLTNPRVIVSGKTTDSTFLKLSPNLSGISIGDQFVSIDGMNLTQYANTFRKLFMSSSNASNLWLDISFLAVRPAKLVLLPETDTTTLVLRRASNGATYTVTLPWLVASFDGCVRNAANAIASARPPISRVQGSIVIPNPPSIVPNSKNPADVAKILKNNTFLGLSPVFGSFGIGAPYEPSREVPSIIQFTATACSSVNWMIYKPQSSNMGVVKISAFIDECDLNQVVLIIRDLMLNELKGTRSLLFDVRENGGGYTLTPERIIPYLSGNSSSSSSIKYRATINKVNDAIFSFPIYRNIEKAFVDAYFATKRTAAFSTPAVLSNPTRDSLNGAAYLKPIGVYTDPLCASACDSFAAMVQDTGAGVIFGTGPQTSGLGANSQITRSLGFLPDYFPSLPLSDKTSDIAPIISFAWRQMVRANGSPLETYGVKPNYIVQSPASDFSSKSSDYVAYKNISDQLVTIGTQTGRANLLLTVSEDATGYSHIGGSFRLTAQYTGFSCVDIVSSGSVSPLAASPVATKDSPTPRTVTLTGKHGVTKVGLAALSVRATPLSTRAKAVNVRRYIRILPTLANYAPINATRKVFNWNFNTSLPNVGIYTYENVKPSLGWNKNGNSLVVGDNVIYEPELDTRASVFVKVSKSATVTLSVAGTMEIEDGADGILFGYQPDGGDETIVGGFSGFDPDFAADFTFTPTTSDYVEVFMRFTSDYNTGYTGPTIKKFTVSIA